MEPRVVRISVAPVKSLGLVHPEEVVLEQGGVVGNRRFWLRDEQGALYAGKRDGSMMRIRPEWDESTRRLALAFPDGERVEGVVELGEPVDAELYRLVRPSHRVVGPWEEALSRFVGRPLELLWADDGAVDRSPRGGTVSLVSRASLERLGEEVGTEDALDGRRFRMLFEIDGVDAHEEDSWIGQEIRIGEATVTFNGDVGRCIVTSRDPDTGVVDLPTLVTLAAYRRDGVSESLPFGVYGSVLVPGRVRVGDIAQRLYSSEWQQPAAAPS
ncbi:MAG TPA: MOSC N-terminal beta barrel domain-containing protein [Gaiellaceae bacterium]|nr:MOSC N-terminal beta barrel domain-containing protein [Gaiellaceae bacterium]